MLIEMANIIHKKAHFKSTPQTVKSAAFFGFYITNALIPL